MAIDVEANREFSFTRSDFRDLVSLVREHTGIALSDTKFNMAYGRIVRRLRPLGLRDCKTYLQHIGRQENASELVNFVNTMTTNLTSFFREDHHFDLLRSRLADDWLPAIKAGERDRIRIWSAGCSSGEEPYSMSITLAEAMGKNARDDVLILATDIDTNMLARGQSGQYSAESVEAIKRGRSHFRRSGDGYQASETLKQRIRFKRLNLMHAWPIKGQFDAIFCRNVLIYFEPETRRAIAKRFIDQLSPGGILCLGHSESLVVDGLGLTMLGKSSFEKPGGPS